MLSALEKLYRKISAIFTIALLATWVTNKARKLDKLYRKTCVCSFCRPELNGWAEAVALLFEDHPDLVSSTRVWPVGEAWDLLDQIARLLDEYEHVSVS